MLSGLKLIFLQLNEKEILERNNYLRLVKDAITELDLEVSPSPIEMHCQ